MNIVPATVDHATAIAAVHVQSWQAAYAGILGAEFLQSLSVSDRSRSWNDILTKDESRTLVACRENEVLGFVSYGRCRDEGASEVQGEIWALYAQPQVWGQGVGRALLEEAVHELRTLGRDVISLWVLRQNHRAVAFYEAFGFQRASGPEKLIELGGRKVQEICMRLQ